MHETAEKVAELMKVLANPKRLLILCQLGEQERSVGELARLLDVREQAMSQQLALLRKDGLVVTRREGQTIHYALARGDIALLLDFLYRTYCTPPEDGQGLTENQRHEHEHAPDDHPAAGTRTP